MLILYFPPFRATSQDELIDQCFVALKVYVEELISFNEDTLKSGWRSVLRAHKVERWPTLEQIHSACMEYCRPDARAGDATKPRGSLDITKERYAEAMAMADTERSRQMVAPLWKQACREGWMGHLLSEINRRLNIFHQHHVNGKHVNFAIFFQSHEIDCIRSGSACAVAMSMDNPISFPEDWAFQIGTETRRAWQDIAAEKDVIGEDGEIQNLSSYAGGILQAVKSGKPLRFSRSHHVPVAIPELSR